MSTSLSILKKSCGEVLCPRRELCFTMAVVASSCQNCSNRSSAVESRGGCVLCLPRSADCDSWQSCMALAVLLLCLCILLTSLLNLNTALSGLWTFHDALCIYIVEARYHGYHMQSYSHGISITFQSCPPLHHRRTRRLQLEHQPL